MGCELDYVNGLGGGWRMPSKPCDSCRTQVAALFCRTDAAFLCLACDDGFHGAGNKLSSRHARVWVCEVCEHAPAAVTCKADAAVLCVSCDADIHSANPLARRHERVPVVPFLDSAAAALKSTCELDVFLSEADGGPRAEDEAAPPWMEVPKIISEAAEVKCMDTNNNNNIVLNVMDDPYVDFDFGFPVHGGSDSVVPVQVKTEDQPLFQVMKPPEKCFDIDFCRSKLTSFAFPPRKNLQTSSSSPDFGLVPEGSTTNTSLSDRSQSFVGSINSYVTAAGSVGNSCVTADTAPPAAPVPVTPLSGVDREARVLRYREKRKNRKFEKTIRYASRKAYAETRPRIKGRFAKRTDSSHDEHQFELIDNTQMFGRSGSTALFFGDSDFGIVPTF